MTRRSLVAKSTPLGVLHLLTTLGEGPAQGVHIVLVVDVLAAPFRKWVWASSSLEDTPFDIMLYFFKAWEQPSDRRSLQPARSHLQSDRDTPLAR